MSDEEEGEGKTQGIGGMSEESLPQMDSKENQGEARCTGCCLCAICCPVGIKKPTSHNE